MIARHPNTTFICAHMANDGEDLAEVGRWLDAYPNMYVDIDARISELGRQPYSARRFFLKYQDRDHVRHRHGAQPRRPTGSTTGSSRPTTNTSTRPAATTGRASG